MARTFLSTEKSPPQLKKGQHMHKGVILLVKASTREEATQKAEQFLHQHEGDVWDWYQIGGRWTGQLTGYDPEMDPDNLEEVCKTCEGKGCNVCDGKGGRPKWPTDWKPVDDDVMPLTDARVGKKVSEWSSVWEEKAMKEADELMESFKENKFMLGYALEKKANILKDRFTFDSNVYDIEAETNQVPSNPDGYWAVMVDMHD